VTAQIFISRYCPVFPGRQDGPQQKTTDSPRITINKLKKNGKKRTDSVIPLRSLLHETLLEGHVLPVMPFSSNGNS
jgi:hypothetical protein